MKKEEMKELYKRSVMVSPMTLSTVILLKDDMNITEISRATETSYAYMQGVILEELEKKGIIKMSRILHSKKIRLTENGRRFRRSLIRTMKIYLGG